MGFKIIDTLVKISLNNPDKLELSPVFFTDEQHKKISARAGKCNNICKIVGLVKKIFHFYQFLQETVSFCLA